MDELKMTGNCLKGSRGILSFDKAFEESEWGKLTKEVFTHVRRLLHLCQRWYDHTVQIFGVPPQARKAKPFVDHILTFSIVDGKIWFRNFQVCIWIVIWSAILSQSFNITCNRIPDRREGPAPTKWSSTNVLGRDRPAVRPHSYTDI